MDATTKLDEIGLSATVEGFGPTIICQHPAPSVVVAAGSILQLATENGDMSGGSAAGGSSDDTTSTKQALTLNSTGLSLTDPGTANPVFLLFSKPADPVDTNEDGIATFLRRNLEITRTTEQGQEILARPGEIGFNAKARDV